MHASNTFQGIKSVVKEVGPQKQGQMYNIYTEKLPPLTIEKQGSNNIRKPKTKAVSQGAGYKYRQGAQHEGGYQKMSGSNVNITQGIELLSTTENTLGQPRGTIMSPPRPEKDLLNGASGLDLNSASPYRRLQGNR